MDAACAVMVMTQPEPVSLIESTQSDLMRALLRAPAAVEPLLAAALGPLSAAVDATFGALLVLAEGALRAAVDDLPGAADPERLTLLLTQGIAGYAVARRTPVLVRDIAADPRWGPPALDPALPTAGAALALPLADPPVAVLVLVTPDGEAFTPETVDWLEDGLSLLHGPLMTALALETTAQAFERQSTRDALRGDLGAMALHDMRSPLQNIQLAFAAIARLATRSIDEACAERVHELIRLGQHSAAHLTRLSTTLLDVVRLEGDQIALASGPATLDAAISGALQATGALFEAAGCTLTLDVAPGLPAVAHDPALIERVLINLLDNASKHTPPGGDVRLSALPFDGGLTVRVEDSGPGIPPELREEIFARYFQIRPANGMRFDGVGLGLAFCRLAILAHGGEIWAEGGADGGAVFAFTLPGAS